MPVVYPSSQRAGLNPPEPGPRSSGNPIESALGSFAAIAIILGVPLRFRSCEMCDALVAVNDYADRGFCSADCRARHDRLADELDKTMTKLHNSLRALRERAAS